MLAILIILKYLKVLFTLANDDKFRGINNVRTYVWQPSHIMEYSQAHKAMCKSSSSSSKPSSRARRVFACATATGARASRGPRTGSSSSRNRRSSSRAVWGMTKTGVEGAEGWRGRTQRRTTLFTSRDGWDSSVGWL